MQVPSIIILRVVGVSQTTPLVRVAVEPLHVADMKRVEEGLQLLNRSDPCVEVIPQENGELHLLVLGELHLEVCSCNLHG